MKSLLLLTALITTPCSASSSERGKILNPIVNNAGRFFFDSNGRRGGRPACGIYDRWAVDVTTAKGQAMLALVLTAYSQGKLITVNGTSDCRDWPDTEAIDHVIVHD